MDRRVICKRCGNDDARMFETVIYGKRWDTVFCNVCAKEFEVESARDEDE
jgi:hypothetical protein